MSSFDGICSQRSDFRLIESDRRTNNTQTINMKERRWNDLLRGLIKRGKVENAAIINFEGEIVAISDQWKISPGDAVGLLNATLSTYPALTKLSISQHTFTCFTHGSNGTIVGRADSHVLVAHRSEKFIVVGVSDPEAPGSCIYEVVEFGKHIGH